MDAKQTLINLHKKFPEFTLDMLFEILDCYVPQVYLNTTSNWTLPDFTVTCAKPEQFGGQTFKTY